MAPRYNLYDAYRETYLVWSYLGLYPQCNDRGGVIKLLNMCGMLRQDQYVNDLPLCYYVFKKPLKQVKLEEHYCPMSQFWIDRSKPAQGVFRVCCRVGSPFYRWKLNMSVDSNRYAAQEIAGHCFNQMLALAEA